MPSLRLPSGRSKCRFSQKENDPDLGPQDIIKYELVIEKLPNTGEYVTMSKREQKQQIAYLDSQGLHALEL